MRFNFDKTIYKKEGIEEAINQFNDTAKFKITKNNNGWEVQLIEISKDKQEIIFDEFANFVLLNSQNL